MESAERKIKNRAFKMQLVSASKGDVTTLASFLLLTLSHQGPSAFEVMEESGAPFTMSGYKQAAKFIIEQMKNEDAGQELL